MAKLMLIDDDKEVLAINYKYFQKKAMRYLHMLPLYRP